MRLEGATRKRLSRARDLLADASEGRRSVEDVARAIGISPFHFIRQFEVVFGVTPHQFRIQTRLDRVKLLLANGSSVTEACMAVGFSSLGSFSDQFSRRVGMSPSSYRRRMRTLLQVPGNVGAVLMPGCLNLMTQLPASAFRSFREASANSDR
jgi:AraC-like DNA-binding protein